MSKRMHSEAFLITEEEKEVSIKKRQKIEQGNIVKASGQKQRKTLVKLPLHFDKVGTKFYPSW